MWSDLVRNIWYPPSGVSDVGGPTNAKYWLLFNAFSGIYVVAMSLSLLQGFHQYCNTSNALTRALSSAAYTVYLIHPFAIAFAVWTLFKIYKAEGYDISQKMDLDLGIMKATREDVVHSYVPDATWPVTYWVNSAWDDDESWGDNHGLPDQNSWGIGRLWGYKSWGGWLWLCFISNVVVWPVAYAIKQLPGVRSVNEAARHAEALFAAHDMSPARD